MLTRRLFLGTTAGVLGLFGAIGRLRFRQSGGWTRPIFSVRHNNTATPFRDIEFTRDAAGRLFAFYGDAPMRVEGKPDENGWHAFGFGEVVDGRRHAAAIKCRIIGDDEAQVDYVAFAISGHDRPFDVLQMFDGNRRTTGPEWFAQEFSDVVAAGRGTPFGDFIPIDSQSYAPAGGWNALG